jgi:hypothetical protein
MAPKADAEPSIAKQLAELRRMTAGQLQAKYAEVFGEVSRSKHKEWLVKRIAWRIQANLEGGLSERAKRRAEELACEADLRLKAPRTLKVVVEPLPVKAQVTGKVAETSDSRLPPAGTVITRMYKGRQLQVTVRPNGFEYAGEIYGTLSSVAKMVTGSHCNGYLFFKLGQYKDGGAK